MNEQTETARVEPVVMRVLVVVDGPKAEDGKHGGYFCRVSDFDGIPRKGDSISFLVGTDRMPETTPFGEVNSVDWHEGHAMLWCDGSELWSYGVEESELTASGWQRCDPWRLLQSYA